ncbi:MAG: invasion associated locus B family protein [Planktomarina sp.]
MFRKTILTATLGLGLAASSVAAQTTTNRVAAETDWSVFVETNPTECFAVSAPKETINTRNGEPAPDVRRSDILLFVFDRPGADVKGQLAFTGGYPFASGPIKMEVDGRTFDLSTNGEWAWPPTPEDDATIIAAMRRGAKAVIRAQSSRGTRTQDEFSLLGFTAAVAEAQKRCAS